MSCDTKDKIEICIGDVHKVDWTFSRRDILFYFKDTNRILQIYFSPDQDDCGIGINVRNQYLGAFREVEKNYYEDTGKLLVLK